MWHYPTDLIAQPGIRSRRKLIDDRQTLSYATCRFPMSGKLNVAAMEKEALLRGILALSGIFPSSPSSTKDFSGAGRGVEVAGRS